MVSMLGAGAQAVDISKATIGKFCAEAGAFVVSAALGEIEFEVEENEVTLTVAVSRFCLSSIAHG